MVAFSKLNQYGLNFQTKVISSLLKNKKFLLNIRDVITSEYFDNQAHQWIIEQIVKYFDKYHSTPTLDTLHIEVKKIDNDVLKTAVIDQLKEAYKASNEDAEYVENEFSNFCKNQQLKKALLTSVDLLGNGMYDDIRHLINGALKAGMDKNIGHEYEKDVEDRYRDEYRKAIATPWSVVNELLQGGLGGGDFGLIFGGPGGGKSWSLIALGAAAVQAGYNVCHYTLELSEAYIGKRYDACFTNISVAQIQEHRKDVETVVSNLSGRLIIKEYPMGKATISTIESHIQKCRDLDQAPDLVLIDYVDLLKADRSSKDRKDEIDDVYVAAKGLARELNLPIWSVSQVNRAGANDNIIEGDKAAGSYNKMMITDFAMSLSRRRQDKAGGTGRFHIMKNRYGMDGITYAAIIDTSTGRIDIDTNELSEEDMENERPKKLNENFDSFDRDILKKKFFELNNTSNS
jgi:replicative DNA helicase